MICRARERCQTSVGSVPATHAASGSDVGLRRATHRYSPGVSRIALRRHSGRCYPLRALGAGDVRGSPRSPTRILGKRRRAVPPAGFVSDARGPWPRYPVLANATHSRPAQAGSHRRMDAKQVWRAALGELQVSLSPANFETWLRDTQLVDVDDQRFRIAVPNGFAKDWLESRYRSLISQTLARIVGYSVQVEFVIGAAAGAAGRGGPRRRRGAATPGRRRPPVASRSGSSRPGSAARAGRPTSTRATPSPTSSSGRRTGWPTPPACRSRSARATPTTRSSCTAAWASARPT